MNRSFYIEIDGSLTWARVCFELKGLALFAGEVTRRKMCILLVDED